MIGTIVAGIEEGGLSFILFVVMVLAIYFAHRLTIPK